MANKKQKFIDWVNKEFPPASKEYPVAFKREDGYIVTSECGCYETINGERFESKACDYYEMYFDTLGVHPRIDEQARKMGLFLEWENAGALVVYDA